MNINVSRSAAPKLALVPACRYNCDVRWSYVNVCAKFHFGLKEFRMGVHVLKLNKGLRFARKLVNITVSKCAAPKLALVPASRCDVKLSYVNVCAKFH